MYCSSNRKDVEKEKARFLRALEAALKYGSKKKSILVTDSQVFKKKHLKHSMQIRGLTL